MRPYTLARSRRKSIAIHITPDATVEVRAPLFTPRAAIDRFVAGKEGWIAAHLLKRQEELRARAEFMPYYGGTALLCGQPYPIAARPGTRAGFDGACFYMPPDLPPAEIRRVLIRTYKGVARQALPDKTAQFAAHMGVTPAGVRVTDAKTRWGSCSGKNNLCFSWRLILADDDAVDYVVVHELAHIVEHNHSARFWTVVEGVLPDWKARREKLRVLQAQLARENWDNP